MAGVLDGGGKPAANAAAATGHGARARRPPCHGSMPFEKLHGALVLLRSGERFEGPEVSALAGLGVLLAGIKPVLAGCELADHITLLDGKRFAPEPVPALMAP